MSTRDEAAVAVYRSIVRAAVLLRRESDRILSPAGLTGPQFAVLSQLDAGGRMPLGELGKRLWVSCGNVTGLVDKLSSAGLVRRTRLRADRRVVLAELTEKGRKLIAELRPIYREQAARMAAGLDESELQQLQVLLGRICSPALDAGEQQPECGGSKGC
jgi:DNA-binding MarR family transcriptional regulator